MKKMIMSLVACLLLGAMALTGFGAENALVLSGAEGKPGELVYMTMSLTEPVIGDSMAVTYTYDKNILSPELGAFSWEQKGLLQDFGKTNNAGVWAAKETVKLEGDICVLAFRVLEGAKLTETSVSCTLIVKNSDQEAGRFMAQGSVWQQCEHEFGKWQDIGSLGHSRVCANCGRSQTQSHNYDTGQDKTDASGATVKQFTCVDCNAYKQLRLNQAAGEEQVEFSPGTTLPGNSAAGSSPGGSQSGDSHLGHDHGTENAGSEVPGSTGSSADGEASQDPDHTHTDGSGEADGTDPKVTALVIGGAAAVLIAAAVLFLKKKK